MTFRENKDCSQETWNRIVESNLNNVRWSQIANKVPCFCRMYHRQKVAFTVLYIYPVDFFASDSDYVVIWGRRCGWEFPPINLSALRPTMVMSLLYVSFRLVFILPLLRLSGISAFYTLVTNI